MGWVRKKWERLSRLIVASRGAGKDVPKSVLSSSGVGRCKSSPGGIITRSRPRRSREVITKILAVTHENRPGTIVDQHVLVDDLAFAANLINASSSILSESILSGKCDARQFPQAPVDSPPLTT